MALDLPAELTVLAQNNFGDTRAGGLAGPMGLFIVVLLAIATVLLIRNMNTRIRRLPDRFPDQDGSDPDAGGTPGAAGDGSPDGDDRPADGGR